MKKTTLLILLAVAVMLLGISVSAYAESKADYYGPIEKALGDAESAISANDDDAFNSALSDLRTAVYAAARYLASIGEYDARIMNIVGLVSKAQNTADFASLTNLARCYAKEILLGGVTCDDPVGTVWDLGSDEPVSSHS